MTPYVHNTVRNTTRVPNSYEHEWLKASERCVAQHYWKTRVCVSTLDRVCVNSGSCVFVCQLWIVCVSILDCVCVDSGSCDDPHLLCTASSSALTLIVQYVSGWPEPYIYRINAVLLAGKSRNIRSYTAYTYNSGQPDTYAILTSM